MSDTKSPIEGEVERRLLVWRHQRQQELGGHGFITLAHSTKQDGSHSSTSRVCEAHQRVQKLAKEAIDTYFAESGVKPWRCT